MEWLQKIFVDPTTVESSLLIIALVIALGLALGTHDPVVNKGAIHSARKAIDRF
jgi:hypothetical protein